MNVRELTVDSGAYTDFQYFIRTDRACLPIITFEPNDGDSGNFV